MSNSPTSYQAIFPFAKNALHALKTILKKGQDAPNADNLPSARIHEDMLPLTMQVFIACAHANKLVVRTTGREMPQFENNLSTFEDMQNRVLEAESLLDSVDEAVVNERAFNTTSLETEKDKTSEMSIFTYATSYSLPNIFFHVVTAYDILRKEGVPLGKADYEDSFLARHFVQ